MENNIKYWSDYNIFIKTSEEITGLIPADLLDKYKILIEELEVDGDCF